MNPKDKENKLKQFFKKKQSGNIKKTEFVLTDDVMKDLSKGSNTNVRTKALIELGENMLVHKLEENTILKLWYHIRDLVTDSYNKEVRDIAFTFLRLLIVGQYERLINIMRAELFRFIKQHNIPEDLPQRFELLQALTSSGRDLVYFEEEAAQFLLSWAKVIAAFGKEEEYLGLLLNIIKFNAAYLDDGTILIIVREISYMMSNSKHVETVTKCLQILDALIAYSNIPSAALSEFIAALCRIVHAKEHCLDSWNVMRNLLGTHMGHRTIYIMCHILQDVRLRNDASLFRGAVFFIHVALWSQHQVTKLLCPTHSVLPSFLEALKCSHPGVSYEVIVGIQDLVIRSHNELMDPVWEIIMEILSYLVNHTDEGPDNEINRKILVHVHQTLDMIEISIDSEVYNGNVDHFYKVIEDCIDKRSEISAYRLIDHLTRSIIPLEGQWVNNLHVILQKYFKHDVRINLRLKVLENLDKIVQLFRRHYEDELIDMIIIPHMSNIHTDPEVMFRANSAKLLIDMCLVCESKKCLEILEILEKLLLQPFDDHNYEYTRNEVSDFYDTVCLVSGLIQIFVKKMQKLPSIHALKTYEMLVLFLDKNYKYPQVFEQCTDPRFMIFECFLKMRADNKYHLGYPIDGVPVFSPYLCITYKNKEKGPLGSPPPTSPAVSQIPHCTITYVSLRKIFNVFITSLSSEKDWKILGHILQELPKVLQNKNLILSKDGNKEVYLLVDTLKAMILDRTLNLPETLNVKVNKPDFHSAVLLVMLNLASYCMYVPPLRQQKLIASLMNCIKILNKSLKNCISALMVCALEMREAMMKLLPSVLLSLSQTSATTNNALPMLEFLSVLSQLPQVYSNFTGTQYMAIFAITLPYTNPFKYNTYIASLAHYVIAIWFLKCRLPLRKEFVKYITTGLQTNVLIPFEEEKAALRNEMQRLNELNKDSADRKRSSSLTEQGRPRRRAATVSSRAETNKPKPYLQKPSLSSSVLTFYQELTETCVDLMARYAFQQPRQLKRGSLSDYLLKKGQQMTWIIGRTVVTITTSGCSQNVLRNGICETCWETINKESGNNKESGDVSRQNSNEKSDNDVSVSSPVDEDKKISDLLSEQLPSKLQEFIEDDSRYACPCWCMGWAEVHYRRPTGDMIFLIRISPEVLNFDVPLTGLTKTYMPFLDTDHETQEDHSPEELQLEKHEISQLQTYESTEENDMPGSPIVKNVPSRQSSKESIDEEADALYDDGTTLRNPVKRSNSSPEMSPSWKNPFLRQRQECDEDDQNQEDENIKKSKIYSKDLKVSCEAIPEEIAYSGTTPPKSAASCQSAKESLSTFTVGAISHHPSLLSCHSYPGSSPPNESSLHTKTCQTVPASPNTVSANKHQPSFPSRTLAFLKGAKSDSLESTSSEKGLERFSNISLSYLPLLSAKPPQSPTQMSSRLPRHMLIRDKEGHEIQKSSSSSIIEKTTNLSLARDKARERKNIGSLERMAIQDINQSHKRDRVHTVSVMSSTGNKHPDQPQKTSSPQQPTRTEKAKSGLSPSLIFIHMYHSAVYGFKGERALLVSDASLSIQRSLKILDSIPPYQTYTIGIIYIGEGQCNNEIEILRNSFGSMRFVEFLQSLGNIIKLQDADPQVTFLGGLEQNGNDGNYAYVWEDDFIKIMFHVATMMPTRETDPKCTNKKKHIGNDSVVIVYNESSEEYCIDTLKGQMNFASIIIEPLEHNSNRITIKSKNDLDELIGSVDPLVVSEQNVAVLTRQLALHYDLASQVLKSSKTSAKDPYSSNWLERLRKIKQVREKLLEEKDAKNQNKPIEDPVFEARLNNIEDITEYT